jgi:hypothetical protein
MVFGFVSFFLSFQWFLDEKGGKLKQNTGSNLISYYLKAHLKISYQHIISYILIQ